jgi:O-antigen ligase
MPGACLLAAVAWAVAARGGTRPVDLVVVTTLTGAALLLTGLRPVDLRAAPRHPLTLALAALVAWMVGTGLASDAGAAAVRMPWLLVVAALASVAAARLGAEAGALVLDGLVVVGAVVAGSAVLDWLSAVREGADLPVRAATLVGYPNAAGALLVATGLVTLHLWRSGRLARGWATALVTLQTLGVLATGSRLALLLTLLAVVLLTWRRRSATALLTASALALPVVALLVQRFATSSTERLRLWADAVSQIAAHPVAGRGPTPVLLASSLPGRPTTHAHDEVLQLGVEYGLVGLGLLLLALTLAGLALRARRLVDPLLALAGLAVASLALTDFALRTTAAALVLAVLVPLAWQRPGQP